MQRIIIPTHYVHTRSTPLWTKETAPASIWRRHLDAAPGRASTLVSR